MRSLVLVENIIAARRVKSHVELLGRAVEECSHCLALIWVFHEAAVQGPLVERGHSSLMEAPDKR